LALVVFLYLSWTRPVLLLGVMVVLALVSALADKLPGHSY
jgi:hypothetical protein